jgi:cytolysin (calcineurin-like family phosphatase)
VHVPVYVGLGNHDLDQDGPPPHVDWYRREMRDYVEINHRPSVFFKPPVPAAKYDMLSDCYSWDGAACTWCRRTASPATSPRAPSVRSSG